MLEANYTNTFGRIESLCTLRVGYYYIMLKYYVRKELKKLSIKVQTTVQPVFVSRKICKDHSTRNQATDRQPTKRRLSFSM